MEFFSGLDVSIGETAICVVDDKGAVHLQTSVATDPEAILRALRPFLSRLRRAGHEAGSLSPWLHPKLTALGIPVVCQETRHVRAAMSAQRNKTDAADALGLAHIVRTGWFKAAFIKSEPCYRMRLLLSQRRNLKRKFLDLENSIRHSLKAFGIRFKNTGRGGFEAAVREAVAGDKLTSELMDAMLIARAAPWKRYGKVHDLVVKLVARDELCRRFMAIPGVGPVTALSFHDGDRRSVALSPLARRRGVFWLDLAALAVWYVDRHPGPDQQGRRPRCAARALRGRVGDADAVQGQGQGQGQDLALMLAKRGCHHKAAVAVARKLAVIMHAMWSDGTVYIGDPAASETDVSARAVVKDRKLLGAHA